jgi:PAS domain S-box-containing protein
MQGLKLQPLPERDLAPRAAHPSGERSLGGRTPGWLIALGCVALSASLLVLDVLKERSFNFGIPQILVVLIALLGHRRWMSVGAAVLATLAIWLGFFLSPVAIGDAAALINRILVCAVVWLTTAAGLAFQRSAAAQRRLAEIVEATSDAIARVDLEGSITAWNAGAERIYGWRAEEALGSRLPADLRAILGRIAAGERVPTLEISGQRKDGSPLELSMAISPLHDARGVITAFSISARDIAPLKGAERALRDLNERLTQRVEERTADLQRSLEELASEIDKRRGAERELRSLTRELLLVEERERRQLAQDLHDGLGQTLTLAIMRLAMLREALDPTQQRTAAGIESLLCEAQESSTSLSFRLSPPLLYDMGFVPAVQWLCDDIERSYGVKVELDDDDRPKTLDDQIRAVVFRCTRELLINVAKHAGTPAARVSIRRTRDHLHVIVADDGVGFDPGKLAAGGFGVASVRERLHHVGGRLSIDSRPGAGTTAAISAPLVRKVVQA